MLGTFLHLQALTFSLSFDLIEHGQAQPYSLNMPIIYRQGALIELVMKLTYRCTLRSRENFPIQACVRSKTNYPSPHTKSICVCGHEEQKQKKKKTNHIGKTLHVLLLYCFPMQFPCGFLANPENKVKYKKKLIKPLKIQAQTVCAD